LKNRDNLKKTLSNFEVDVGDQISKLDGLNEAASRIYSESLEKSRVVKAME